MTIIRNTLQWAEEDYHGESGWIQKDAPKNFSVGDGRLIAHDVLEHFDSQFPKDSWEDEMLALGAVLFVRGESDYFYNPMRNSQGYAANIAYELSECFSRVNSLGRQLKKVAPSAEIDDSALSEFETAIEMALEYHEKEWEECASEENKEAMLSLLIEGYIQAEKRFGVNYQAYDLFIDLEKQINRVIGYAEPFYEIEIEVDSDECTVKVWIKEYEDE